MGKRRNKYRAKRKKQVAGVGDDVCEQGASSRLTGKERKRKPAAEIQK